MRRVLIGLCGGIALYKMPDLVRSLTKKGYEVRTVMTPFARKFVGELTFRTLAKEAYTDEDWERKPLLHVELARWAEAFLIAPLTANTLSKLALGIADNLLTTTALAYGKPMLLAPAMNAVMLRSKPVQENLKKLKETGHLIVEPERGLLACEEEGEGKLASVERLEDWIEWALNPKPLKGKKVLVTAGATREYLDPVRYLSNESSGKMGFSLARVARWLGAEVEVVAGFTEVPPPPEVKVHRVKSALEMLELLKKLFPSFDWLVMNAAVADFRPAESYSSKIKKRKSLTLKLVKNPDLLSELAPLKGERKVVGFALETEDLLKNAREKLKKKNLDAVVANPPAVMGGESFEGYLITREEVVPLSAPDKLSASRLLFEHLLRLFD